MAKQNIFDNEIFFNEYSKLRKREVNANNLFELPTLYELLPDLKGKRVIDLGCGTGERCIDYIKRGAASVTGIDISEKPYWHRDYLNDGDEEYMKRLFEIDLNDYKDTDAVFRRPSARAIILQGDKIALVYSKKEKYFKFPGGGIHDDEDKREALICEVREEAEKWITERQQ